MTSDTQISAKKWPWDSPIFSETHVEPYWYIFIFLMFNFAYYRMSVTMTMPFCKMSDRHKLWAIITVNKMETLIHRMELHAISSRLACYRCGRVRQCGCPHGWSSWTGCHQPCINVRPNITLYIRIINGLKLNGTWCIRQQEEQKRQIVLTYFVTFGMFYGWTLGIIPSKRDLLQYAKRVFSDLDTWQIETRKYEISQRVKVCLSLV